MIGKSSPRQLLDYMKANIDDTTLLLRIVQCLLSEVRNNQRTSYDDFIEYCLSYLIELARKKGITPEHVMKSEQKNIDKCGALLNTLLSDTPSPNAEIARQNLSLFPKIRSFFGEALFQTEGNTLLTMLSMEDLVDFSSIKRQLQETEDERKNKVLLCWLNNNILPLLAFLSYLEDLFSVMDSNEKGTRELRTRLCGKQFYETLSELELFGRLRKKGIQFEPYPDIEREVDGLMRMSKADALVKCGDSEIVVEVLMPDLQKELKYWGSAMLKNRLLHKVVDEYAKHFKGMKKMRKILFVVDTTRSHDPFHFAEDVMKGPEVITFTIDKGTIIEVSVNREESKSVIKRHSEINLAGIIAYRRQQMPWGHYATLGIFYENPHVMTEEERKICKEIFKALVDFEHTDSK